MRVKNISLEQLKEISKLTEGRYKYNEVKEGLFYKYIFPYEYEGIIRESFDNNIYFQKQKKLEKKLLRLEKMGIWKLEESNSIIEMAYCENVLIYYVTKELKKYVNLIDLADLETNIKIDLLKKASMYLKQIHQRGLLHSDYHLENILSDGKNIKVIDFDDSKLLLNQKITKDLTATHTDISIMVMNIINMLVAKNVYTLEKEMYGDLPKEITKYFQDFSCFSRLSKRKILKLSETEEYPHYYLDEFRDYEFIEGKFQKK